MNKKSRMWLILGLSLIAIAVLVLLGFWVTLS